jgi:hypothetical protein
MQRVNAGLAMRIQISETTFKILRKTGNYIMQERTDIQFMINRMPIKTYWVFGKAGIDLDLPNPDDWPIIGHKKG